MATKPLASDRLYRPCAAEGLPFRTTAELADLDGPLGQERAISALEFGTALRGPGYHVFALGPPGVGKRTVTERLLARRAAAEPVPSDWCYLNNFSDPQTPRALRLPPGRAARFRRDMDRLLEDLRAAIPAAFESDDYRTRLQVMERMLLEDREQAMRTVQEHAQARQLMVGRMPVGFVVAPMRDGQVIDPEAFRQLPQEEQDRIQKEIAIIQEELAKVLRETPQREHAHREKVKQLNRDVTLFAVGHLIDHMRETYADLPGVLGHLDAVQTDVVENVRDFLGAADGADVGAQIRKALSETPGFLRYRVNVVVDQTEARGAPVVFEDYPTYPNLIGRIEHHAHFGTLTTDFTMIRPGTLHRANGGYLLLDARRLLVQPLAWEQLKRSLDSGKIRIEPPERAYGLSGSASLEPEPIPLDIKVVLLGDRSLYHLLAQLDPEFLEHFKVAADFEDEVPRAGNELDYARLLATLARRAALRPFSREAVALLVEHAARLAGDAERLSAQVQTSADLLREADHFAAGAGRAEVAREDVQAAIEGQLRRHGRVRERLLEEIARGTLLIDTAGAAVGQVNGLSVHLLGQHAFGRPSRITARVRLGKGEVVDIEREVELGGPIHSKGVLILASYLASRYTADRPFTLSASLVFEQSYGGVDGDSASSAELYALVSALSGVPIRQELAVTGSVNQLGQVQAIGGVNEKIEGFFDVCQARGLTGAQGVLIPAANVKHLMLRADVVEACAAGRFHVWAVEHVDEGIEILTGVPAGGARGEDGRFAEGSVNALTAARLERLASQARAFAAPQAPTPREGSS